MNPHRHGGFNLMWGKASGKRPFSLVELLIVMAVLLVLVSLLQPALRNALEYGRSITCKKNLQNLGLQTILYVDDHNNAIPHSHFTSDFDDNNDGIKSTEEAQAHGFAINGFSEAYGWWYSKFSIGQYVFKKPPTADWEYARNEVYDCPSRTFDNPLNPLPLCYGVSTTLWRQVYPSNSNPAPTWARTTSFTRPSELVSMGDLRQSTWGDAYQPYLDFVQSSGAVVFFDRINADPANGNKAIPFIFPAQQNGIPVDYSLNPVRIQRGVDFRHKGESFNASFLDGHVSELKNGEILNRYFEVNPSRSY